MTIVSVMHMHVDKSKNKSNINGNDCISSGHRFMIKENQGWEKEKNEAIIFFP